jgi:hypothetical protein
MDAQPANPMDVLRLFVYVQRLTGICVTKQGHKGALLQLLSLSRGVVSAYPTLYLCRMLARLHVSRRGRAVAGVLYQCDSRVVSSSYWRR